MADDCRGSGGGSVFLAFVLGATIGGGLALLSAPRSGAETRDRMREMADETRDRMREMAEDAESRVKKTVDEGRHLLEEKRDLIQAAVKAGREAMEAERAEQDKPA
jgi:gas vesicle protein